MDAKIRCNKCSDESIETNIDDNTTVGTILMTRQY